MVGSSYIVNVTEADFEYQVLAFSQEMPVIVDFWAEWCAPCRVLGPILEKLAEEAQGGFRLAKVNVDENPNLSKRYQVRNIPNVKAFRDGRLVSEFSGARPEPQVRDFIRTISPNPNDLALEKGLNLLSTRQASAAEIAFRQFLQSDQHHPGALLGLCRSLLYQGKYKECQSILLNFPASREYNSAELLRPLVDTLVSSPAQNEPEGPLHAAYMNSIHLIQHGNLEAAMDGLLDILRQDKRFRDGMPRKLMLAIIELIGADDATTIEYRSELASVLF